MLTREEKDILVNLNDKRVERLLSHAAEHRELYNEIETLKRERDEYRETLDGIYRHMVICNNPDSRSPLKNWKIESRSGASCYFYNITQEEAMMAWRELWGLN